MRRASLYQGSCVPKLAHQYSVATSAKQEQADITRPFTQQRTPNVINAAGQQGIGREAGTATKPDRKKSVNGWSDPQERCGASRRSTKN
ncbi:hypothetical protein BDS110ZK19_72200 [Bradyrhizobium diazoefficiens]